MPRKRRKLVEFVSLSSAFLIDSISGSCQILRLGEDDLVLQTIFLITLICVRNSLGAFVKLVDFFN